MPTDDLIRIWKEGNPEMLKNRRFERAELETFLKPKISKTTLSLNFNILVYMVAQVGAMILIGLDLYGYRSNPVMLKVLIPMFIACSSFFGYGVFLLTYIWQVNHGNFDLMTAINRKLKVYRTYYEVWMWIGAISLLFLIYALTTLVDNDQGTYRINHPVVFVVTSLAVVLFIYGVQKVAQFIAVRQIKVYLFDLQNDALEGSRKIEEVKRKRLIITLILTLIFTLLFVLGVIKAIGR